MGAALVLFVTGLVNVWLVLHIIAWIMAQYFAGTL